MYLSIGSIKHCLCIRKKTRMTVYHFNNQNLCNTQISGMNEIFSNSYMLITVVRIPHSTKLT